MPRLSSPPTLRELRACLTEAQALTFTIYGEARALRLEGRVAVGCATRNRVKQRHGTYLDVCLSPGQFHCWHSWSGETFEHLMPLVSVLVQGGPPPWTDLDRAIYTECCWVTEGIMSHILLDTVKGATHYYNPALPPGVPKWASGLVPVATIQGVPFFLRT